jgi:negative regulator of flagellin synthesis FlgM
MKIDDRLSNYMSLLNSSDSSPSARTKGDSATAAASGSSAVNVDLSAAASQMAEDQARFDKLNTIRQQLAEGSYNISGKDVAEKMLKILKS